MQIPLSVRVNLIRQSLRAHFNIEQNVPVKVTKAPIGFLISTPEQDIHVPAPHLWHLYQNGWDAHLANLAQEYAIGERFGLKPNDIIVDIGANTGSFAHICARAGAHVHCIEPDPKAFPCLRSNTEGLSNVSLYEKAAWKDEGEIEFGMASERAASSVFAETRWKIPRHTITLTKFFDDQSLTHIDLIKCSAEGAEPEILQGATVILNRVRAITFDTSPNRKGTRTHLACTQILKSAGFDVEDILVGNRNMTYGLNSNFKAPRYQKTA